MLLLFVPVFLRKIAELNNAPESIEQREADKEVTDLCIHLSHVVPMFKLVLTVNQAQFNYMYSENSHVSLCT